MDNTIEQSNFSELEKPPTLVAESGSGGAVGKITGGSGSSRPSTSRMSSDDDKTATMPVLQPNVGIGTRTKSGRIHKPARNFTSDEYVVPTLVKRRIPNNSRAPIIKEKVAAAASPPVEESIVESEVDLIRVRLEQKYPKAVGAEDEDNTPITYIISICFKELNHEGIQNTTVEDLHTKIKNIFKTWTKGPYRLKEDEVKFIRECIVKPDWAEIPTQDWRILAEALKDRLFRMRKRFTKVGRLAKKRREDVKNTTNTFLDLGNKIVKGRALAHLRPESDDEINSDEYEAMEEDIDNSSSHSSRISTRSKEVNASSRIRGGSSKTPSLINDEYDLSLGSVGIEEFGGEEEMFDDLDSALVNETKSKDGSGNSMVAALHATLQSRPSDADPRELEPPTLEKDGAMYALELDDIQGTESWNFGDTENSEDMTDEQFAELEGRVLDEDATHPPYLRSNLSDYQQSSSSSQERLDLSALEIEESSGNVRSSGGLGTSGELASPGATMISTKTALMCALKISEDFLPCSHEKYLNRLEESEKYSQGELDSIRRMFDFKPSAAVIAKRKLNIDSQPDVAKKAKVGISNGMSGPDGKPRVGMPYLRSAFARGRKFVEDETTVIEKLGNNKILAAGRVIEIDYENYMKESDFPIPFDEPLTTRNSKLLPPSVSNCHAPSCRLGCICNSIIEDMPPRGHCGRPRCFFECTCQQLLLNSNDDGDIRSRLRPRVSLLNWRAESTEKEKEPMTSYRQMERGTHFIRVRRNPPGSSERLRREFVLDGKVVEGGSGKGSSEMLKKKTNALLHSSHRRMMGKHDQFMRVGSSKQQASTEQLKKRCMKLTVDVKLTDVEASSSRDERATPSAPAKKSVFLTVKEPPKPAMPLRDLEEMKSVLGEVTEECQLLALEHKIAFFSWSTGIVNPKVVMYQVQQGDEFKVPWLYLPIAPQGYSWICHSIPSSFEKTDYVYIPEIQGFISAHALKVNMNTAFVRKKGVVFDVHSTSNSSGFGKIYFFPDLPKVLICGPFQTEQTTVNPKDAQCVHNVGRALAHMEKLKLMKHFGDDESWKKFTSSPTIFPIKKRTDNETDLSKEESRKLFAQIYPTLMKMQTPLNQVTTSNGPSLKQPVTPKPAFGGWSSAVKFIGLGNTFNVTNKSLTEVLTLI